MSTNNKIFPSSKSFGALKLLISVSLFALFFIIVFLLCAVFSGFVLLKLPNPLKMIDAATLISLYFAAIISSFLISKKNGQKYLMCAAFCALLLFAFLFLMSLFTNSGIFTVRFFLRLISLPLCFLGALLGKKREKRVVHKHKRKF